MRTQHFLWLFLIPLFQILLGNDIFLVSSQCQDDQKSLLLQLKDSLQYDSTLSNKLSRWNHMTSECCNWDGVACDLSGHVIALELNNDTISSGIENSSALFSLQYLQKLNLAYNNFNAGIPVGISNLTNLKYLNLSNAGFVGQIPMMLSRLTRLVTLDLSTLLPDFDQPLKLESPNLTKFIENSTELRELYLDGVDLSAQRTEWCQSLSSYLPNLKVLSLRSCQISGPIDESIGKLQMLESLDLSRNHLSGEIPSELASLTFLEVLNLSFNNLYGKIPSSNQFLTFSEDSFEGNRGLCGFPLNNSCESNGSDSLPPPTSQADSDFEWKFIFAAVGNVVGAANTISLLWFYEPVRKWFDKHVE